MTDILVILLVIALVKFVVFGFLLFVVFRRDIREMWSGKKTQKTRPAMPVCMYCQSHFTRRLDDGEPRWDNDDLILVTTYECEHCHLPFWHVERVPVGSAKR